MRTFENSMRSKDGRVNLFLRTWLPDDGDARAVICLSHGIGGHSGRWAHVAQVLTGAGCAVHALDHWGFGRSEGQRGAPPSWDAYLDDFGLLVERARSQHPGLPLFLLGASGGSVIMLDYALRKTGGLDGIISTSTGLIFKHDYSPLLMTVGAFLAALSPRLTTTLPIDISKLAHDPAVGEAVLADPLCHQRISFRHAAGQFDASQRLVERGAELRIPILLLHGGDDRANKVESARQFRDGIGGNACRYIEYQDSYHDLFSDLEKEQVFADVRAWLDQRIEAVAA